MKQLSILLLIAFIFVGCSQKTELHVPESHMPVCRHLAVFNAVTWTNETGERTMIASGPSLTVEGQWHAQAIVMDGMLIRGYLIFDGKKVVLSKQELFIMKDFRSPRYYYDKLMNGEFGGHSTQQN